MKCTHSPSRVPGSRQDSAIWRRTNPPVPRGRGAGSWPSGWSRRNSVSGTSTTSPATALPANAGTQPAPCSTGASTSVETRLPAIPTSPASCAITGARRAGNHRVPSRSTEMKVMASPQPSRARAASAIPYVGDSAKPIWPAVNSTAPSVSTFFVPSRSTIRPTGICIPA
ncbi:hypothetical protein GCM10020254_42840 [Streptomyces goshikiensis]